MAWFMHLIIHSNIMLGGKKLMDQTIDLKKHNRISWYSALIMTFIFMNIGILMEPANNAVGNMIKLPFLILLAISSFFLFYLNKSSDVRWIMFAVLALIMSMWFMTTLYVERHHIGFTQADIENGIPFCHIAIVNQLFSLPFLKTFVSPSRLNGGVAAIYPMILIWLWATVLVGKGWCSWGCFYGGWDNFFAKLTKKPLININEKISNKLRFIPYVLLIVIALMSLYLVTPVFCTYVCPFKAVTEFQPITTFRTWIIGLVTFGSFLAFCVFMPIFFGRRIWCTYLCPFGALQGLFGRIFRVFSLKIDKDKCIDCKKCVKSCKTCGITEVSLQKKKFTFNCSLCGICIDNCPQKAIDVTVFGIKGSVKNLFDKITEKLSNIKIISQIRNVFSNIIGDILNPQSFLLFFGLTVMVNFLSTFYFGFVRVIIK
jgi:polyferredoxin